MPPNVHIHIDSQHNPDKLASCTEYVDNYPEWPIAARVRGKPLPQQLSVGGEFHGGTESRAQYIVHPLPPAFVPRKVVWTGTGLPFDATTTQRSDFPVWPVSARHAVPKPIWISTAGKFDGQTTNKADFCNLGTKPRYQRPPAQYLPNPAKLDGLSSSAEAYRAWPIDLKPVGRHHVAYLPLKDDRDFKSTNSATYVDHPLGIPESKLPLSYFPPPDVKFNSDTTTHDTYRRWPITPRQKQKAPLYIPNTSKFPSDTTYSDNFKPKSVARSCAAVVAANARNANAAAFKGCKFEGVSTHQADYAPVEGGVMRKLPDFAPKKKYIAQKDDRDFVTTSRHAHDLKTA
ncbi:hypothetical protein HK100_007651 [Physocladia obscura]|uniref:Uncharacterized protein n=1 Tax=Physocladia obscura TaxID=109957 RepID=A0AAD5T7A7_9FUNG|nr:hypothetical protein HK100_007651 [Physocladia obscura]